MGPLVVKFVVMSLFFARNFCHGPSQSVSRLVIHSVPELSLFTATEEVFYFSQLMNVTFTPNPIASLAIPNSPNIRNAHSVLSLYSHNDSQFETYVFEVQGEHHSHEHVEQYCVILYAFLAVSVTNLCSLTGISCIPLKKWRHFNYLLNFMVGLAVSALFTTALLVLIPEALRLEETPLEFGGQGQRFLIVLCCVP
ncbi:unnamed protein product, partial [Hymenolepis diminuta]